MGNNTGIFLGGTAQGFNNTFFALQELGMRAKELKSRAQSREEKLFLEGFENIGATRQRGIEQLQAGLQSAVTKNPDLDFANDPVFNKTIDGIVEKTASQMELLAQSDRSGQLAQAFGIGGDPAVFRSRMKQEAFAFFVPPSAKAAAEGRAEATSGLAQAEAVRAANPNVSDEQALAGAGLIPSPRAPISVTVNNPQQVGETAAAKRFGENEGDRAAAIQTGAEEATSRLVFLRAQRAALESGKFEPGALGSARLLLSQAAELVGLNPEELGLGLGNPLTGEIIQAAESNITLSISESLKGNLNKQEIDLLGAAVPGLLKTPAGALVLNEVFTQIDERRIEEAQLLDEFLEASGGRLRTSSDSFSKQLRNFRAENPVVTPELADRINAAQSVQQPAAQNSVKGGDTVSVGTSVTMQDGRRITLKSVSGQLLWVTDDGQALFDAAGKPVGAQ